MLTLIQIKAAELSFQNAKSLLNRIDSLPHGTSWGCSQLKVTGDIKDNEGNARAEEVEIWHRNPVECIRELMGNSKFSGKMRYAPEKIFVDEACTNQEFDEMWTVDWWWDIQVKVNHPPTVEL